MFQRHPFLLRLMVAGMACFAITASAQEAMEEKSSPPATRPAAQDRPNMAQRGRQMVSGRIDAIRRVVESLKPTDEQKQKLDAIFGKVRKEMLDKADELEQANVEMRQRFEQARLMFDDLRHQVEVVLTADQKEAFAKKMEELQQRFGQGPGGAGGRPGGLVQRFRDAIAKLELRDEQKSKVNAILEEANKTFQETMSGMRGDREQMQSKFRELMQDLRQKLSEVLTPEQQDKFRELMQQQPQDGGPPRARERRALPTAPARQKDNDASKADAGPPGDEQSAQAPATGGGAGVEVGSTAPNFELKKLDGRPVQLSSFKGRNLVLVFGSWSTPTFRDSAAALEQLKKQNTLRAEFLIIYTREAHPAGSRQPERNKTDGISVEQPANLPARKALAQKAKDTLHLTIPIVIDSMDDAAAKAYDLIPNGAVIIGKDGQIVFRQKWFDPFALGIALQSAK